MVGRLRLSGLQKQVLALQRAFLRCARSKPVEVRQPLQAYIGAEFRRQAAGVDKKDILRIEHLLRKGKKQLDLLQHSTGFQVASVAHN